MTVPGPFTMSQQAQNDYYPSEEDAAMGYAAAVNEEIRDLFAAGADIVQIDEPYMQARPEKARQYGLIALNRAFEGITGTTAVHICFGYAAIIHQRPFGLLFPAGAGRLYLQTGLGRDRRSPSSIAPCSRSSMERRSWRRCLDLNDMAVESAETVVARIKRALPYVKAENVILAPDCGMKYLPRDVAFGKMKSMVEAAKMLRAELGG